MYVKSNSSLNKRTKCLELLLQCMNLEIAEQYKYGRGRRRAFTTGTVVLQNTHCTRRTEKKGTFAGWY